MPPASTPTSQRRRESSRSESWCELPPPIKEQPLSANAQPPPARSSLPPKHQKKLEEPARALSLPRPTTPAAQDATVWPQAEQSQPPHFEPAAARQVAQRGRMPMPSATLPPGPPTRFETPLDVRLPTERFRNSAHGMTNRAASARVDFPGQSFSVPEPGAPLPPSGVRPDRWPALPFMQEPDPVEGTVAFWREQERRRRLAEEQAGTYGSRWVPHRG